jgi:hypothetical protein
MMIRRLVIGLVAIAVGACEGEIRDRPLVTEPPDNPPAQSRSPSPLIGDWQADVVAANDSLTQTTSIRWHFGNDNTCSVESTTTVRSTIQTATRDCTFVDRGSKVTVFYEDNSSDDLPYTFSSATNQLTIDGVVYNKLG